MKIQFLNGGLANQAFQYIFARYYELSHPGEIMFMDESYFALNTVHNGYELEKVFGIKPHMLSEFFEDEVWKFILEERKLGKSVPQILCENGIDMVMISEVGENHKKFNPFDGKVFSIPCNEYFPQILDEQGDIYYHGYWINENWLNKYKDIFLSEFRFPTLEDTKNIAYLDRITNTRSVSIHIRRGDYVDLGWAFEPALYHDFIEKFVAQFDNHWEVFVFSDDIEWCKKNRQALGLTIFEDAIFVEGNIQGKNYIDLQLMSHCKAMIMSNSAFCYLAALLNTEKEICINPTRRGV